MPFPDRKISETLIDFAEPVVAPVFDEGPAEVVQSAFEIAITVWNVSVFEAIGLRGDYVSLLKETLSYMGGDPVIETLRRRKREAIECHLEGMMLDGEVIPKPGKIEAHQVKREYRGGVWALVGVDVAKLSGRAKRINVTLPERLLHQMDAYASKRGESRSGLIASAALEYLATQDAR